MCGIFINRSKKKISLTQNITYKTWCVNTQLLSSRVSNCFSLICFKIFSTVFKKRMVLKNYDVFFFSKVQGCKLFISLKTHSYIQPIPISLRIVKLKTIILSINSAENCVMAMLILNWQSSLNTFSIFLIECHICFIVGLYYVREREREGGYCLLQHLCVLLWRRSPKLKKISSIAGKFKTDSDTIHVHDVRDGAFI